MFGEYGISRRNGDVKTQHVDSPITVGHGIGIGHPGRDRGWRARQPPRAVIETQTFRQVRAEVVCQRCRAAAHIRKCNIDGLAHGVFLVRNTFAKFRRSRRNGDGKTQRGAPPTSGGHDIGISSLGRYRGWCARQQPRARIETQTFRQVRAEGVCQRRPAADRLRQCQILDSLAHYVSLVRDSVHHEFGRIIRLTQQ